MNFYLIDWLLMPDNRKLAEKEEVEESPAPFMYIYNNNMQQENKNTN